MPPRKSPPILRCARRCSISAAFRRRCAADCRRARYGDGRFPDAPLKFFLTASAEIRAERRYKQLLAQGESVNLRAIYAEIAERDARDRSRSVAPLKPASDAVVIDTGTLSIADVQQQVNAEIAARFFFFLTPFYQPESSMESFAELLKKHRNRRIKTRLHHQGRSRAN